MESDTKYFHDIMGIIYIGSDKKCFHDIMGIIYKKWRWFHTWHKKHVQ